MVEILGKSPEHKYSLTCSNCSTVLGYTKSELVEKKYDFDYLGDYEIGKFLSCPICGHSNLVRK